MKEARFTELTVCMGVQLKIRLFQTYATKLILNKRITENQENYSNPVTI